MIPNQKKYESALRKMYAATIITEVLGVADMKVLPGMRDHLIPLNTNL